MQLVPDCWTSAHLQVCEGHTWHGSSVVPLQFVFALSSVLPQALLPESWVNSIPKHSTSNKPMRLQTMWLGRGSIAPAALNTKNILTKEKEKTLCGNYNSNWFMIFYLSCSHVLFLPWIDALTGVVLLKEKWSDFHPFLFLNWLHPAQGHREDGAYPGCHLEIIRPVN